jgi:hypothetical protein
MHTDATERPTQPADTPVGDTRRYLEHRRIHQPRPPYYGEKIRRDRFDYFNRRTQCAVDSVDVKYFVIRRHFPRASIPYRALGKFFVEAYGERNFQFTP